MKIDQDKPDVRTDASDQHRSRAQRRIGLVTDVVFAVRPRRLRWKMISFLLIAAFFESLRPGTLLSSEPSFVRDVIPVLTKVGCNSGACHGSFGGRGGFRLSLLGFDPEADHDSLVKDGRGRRVSASSPQQSLILRKAGGVTPHGGGLRLTPGSEAFEIVRRWLDHGTPGSGLTALKVTSLKVAPSDLTLAATRSAKLQVSAAWSDGVTQDVTKWALFDSQNNDVTEVTADGMISARGPGRTAVTVRFMGQVGSLSVTVPFGEAADIGSFQPKNFIDKHVQAEWTKLGLSPAENADDSTFLRRVSLDLIGTLPTPDEARAFIASNDPKNREQAIDALLARPEYVDFWALKWGDLLRVHRRNLGEKGLDSVQGWLRAILREKKPATALVRDLLTAQGNLYSNGPVGFYFVDQTPQDLAETTAQIFLGVRMQCAKCHHHPFEVWSQDDYYGLAAFYAGVQRKDTKEGGRFGGAQSIFLTGANSISNPTTGQTIAARVLGVESPSNTENASRRATSPTNGDPRPVLADWIASPSNPYFAKNIVNRYWAYLFGRGLVESMDDMRATNPASHPELLNALADDFIKHDYDFQHLLRTIANSATYQLATNLNPDRDRSGMFYTFHLPRRLPAEVMLDAINQATGTNENFPNLPPTTRAISLPDTAIVSSFLDTFGRPKRTITCECERMTSADITQSLLLANGETIHQKLISKDGRLARLIAAKKTDDEITIELYLATLSRMPTDIELASVRKLLATATSRTETLEDVLWSLLNCAEFGFQH